ncbi:P-type conjugative transfer protein TrbJ [Pelobacter seleniigenes]|uniref:P-type conjugative transfer protein TrbJ n=1 Tax=Pelobacter seleniigenes TaxID=407188 RepID=UPI00068E9F25|nr:P-type conjugative transfer protein TrbJ [Pelobacter seleniigenes]
MKTERIIQVIREGISSLKKLFFSIFLLFAFALPSYSSGIPVVDIAGLAQAVLGYVQQFMSYSQQITQVANQIKQLSNDAKNLSSMNPAQAQSLLYQLQNSLRQLEQIQTETRGISMDYSKAQDEFDLLYPDFEDASGQTAADYAQKAREWNQQTINATADAVKAQGLISNNEQDQESLAALIQASQNASGALQAAQAGNQIASMTTQQILQLQQTMAISQRAQTSYIAEQAAKEAASAKQRDKFFKKPKDEHQPDVNLHIFR